MYNYSMQSTTTNHLKDWALVYVSLGYIYYSLHSMEKEQMKKQEMRRLIHVNAYEKKQEAIKKPWTDIYDSMKLLQNRINVLEKERDLPISPPLPPPSYPPTIPMEGPSSELKKRRIAAFEEQVKKDWENSKK